MYVCVCVCLCVCRVVCGACVCVCVVCVWVRGWFSLIGLTERYPDLTLPRCLAHSSGLHSLSSLVSLSHNSPAFLKNMQKPHILCQSQIPAWVWVDP